MNVKPRFIISDLHLGARRHNEREEVDERATKNFVEFFHAVSLLGGATVLINGDFIDFPHIIVNSLSPPPQKFLGTTEAESNIRMQEAIARHPEEFEALKRFLACPGNELLLILGNHDTDFCWNQVRSTFMKRIGATSSNFKIGKFYKETGVLVTHGHQYSADNRINIPINSTFNRLNSCWGIRFMEHFFYQLEDRYQPLAYARPKWKVVLSTILSENIKVSARIATNFLMFLKNFGIPLTDLVCSSILKRLRWKPDAWILASMISDIDMWISEIHLDGLCKHDQEKRRTPPVEQRFDVDSPASDSKADSFQRAAQVIARHHPDTHAVIMGHTHRGINAKALNVHKSNNRFFYFNTGAWTKTYNIPKWELPRLDKLLDPTLYELGCSVVRCFGAEDGLSVQYFDAWQEAVSY